MLAQGRCRGHGEMKGNSWRALEDNDIDAAPIIGTIFCQICVHSVSDARASLVTMILNKSRRCH
jgi:hypothetical protein